MPLDLTTLSFIVVPVVWVMATINKQGGIKIVSWRIRGQRGFLLTMIEPDKKVFRKPLPMSIVHNSTPRFTYDGGEYFTGGPDETIYAFGMPNWVYDRRDARPRKLVGDPNAELMSASKIHAAFDDDSIERFNGLKQKTSKVNLKLIMYLLLFIMILTIASVGYSYFYGLNANCALHTRACPGP